MDPENEPLIEYTYGYESIQSSRVAASIFSLFVALIHLYMGGPDVITPLRHSALPIDIRAILEGVWHITSAFLLFSAYIFWTSPPVVVRKFAVLWLLSSCALAAVAVRTYSGWSALLFCPQWFLMLFGGLLGIYASDYSRIR